VCEVFSKRSDDIAEHLARTDEHGYRARGVAALATRSVKRRTGVDELLPTWQRELAELSWPVERLVEHLATAQTRNRTLLFPLSDAEIDRLADEVFDVDGRLLANHKIFTRGQRQVVEQVCGSGTAQRGLPSRRVRARGSSGPLGPGPRRPQPEHRRDGPAHR
jgi:hypothetical protein